MKINSSPALHKISEAAAHMLFLGRRAVLPVELLHGITFACGWGAGTINSKRVAPPELAATMQVRLGMYAHVCACGGTTE